MSDDKKVGLPTESSPVIWVCVANVDGIIVSENFSSEDYEVKNDRFTAGFASSEFFLKYNKFPSKIRGPFNDAVILNKNITNKKKKSKIDQNTMIFLGPKKKIVYKGWQGIAHLVRDHENNKAALFLVESELNSTQGKSKAEPLPKIIPISVLRDNIL